MKQIHISRAGRKAQILMNVYEVTAGDTLPVCTAYSIARGIGLRPSDHVRKLIDEMIADGWLFEVKQFDLFGREMRLIGLTTDASNLLDEVQRDHIIDWKTVVGWFEK